VKVDISSDVDSGDLVDLDDQWLGVSVSSQGTEDGSSLACGHRYKQVSRAAGNRDVSSRTILGICYAIQNNFGDFEALTPWSNLERLRLNDDYGLCQVGITSDIDREGNYILGAPGPYNWRGTAFENKFADYQDGSTPFSQIPVADLGPPAMRDYYSYLGMSVKIGTILGGQRTYIVGAPRANNSGQVLLFLKSGNTLVKQHTLSGEQFGSYFGYDMAVADLNGDGWQDLVVGAPFYRDTRVGGAFYVYMNGLGDKNKPRNITSDSWVRITSRPMKEADCVQLDCFNARFGSTVASIGDIDKDGYADIAIGAP